jgi:hypothetical protein
MKEKTKRADILNFCLTRHYIIVVGNRPLINCLKILWVINMRRYIGSFLLSCFITSCTRERASLARILTVEPASFSCRPIDPSAADRSARPCQSDWTACFRSKLRRRRRRRSCQARGMVHRSIGQGPEINHGAGRAQQHHIIARSSSDSERAIDGFDARARAGWVCNGWVGISRPRPSRVTHPLIGTTASCRRRSQGEIEVRFFVPITMQCSERDEGRVRLAGIAT